MLEGVKLTARQTYLGLCELPAEYQCSWVERAITERGGLSGFEDFYLDRGDRFIDVEQLVEYVEYIASIMPDDTPEVPNAWLS